MDVLPFMMNDDDMAMTTMKRATTARAPRCKVDGCNGRLTGKYCRKHLACKPCRQSRAVYVQGQLCRWCSQCGSFHSLADFDGDKRTCREKLSRVKDRRKEYAEAEAESMLCTADTNCGTAAVLDAPPSATAQHIPHNFTSMDFQAGLAGLLGATLPCDDPALKLGGFEACSSDAAHGTSCSLDPFAEHSVLLTKRGSHMHSHANRKRLKPMPQPTSITPSYPSTRHALQRHDSTFSDMMQIFDSLTSTMPLPASVTGCATAPIQQRNAPACVDLQLLTQQQEHDIRSHTFCSPTSSMHDDVCSPSTATHDTHDDDGHSPATDMYPHGVPHSCTLQSPSTWQPAPNIAGAFAKHDEQDSWQSSLKLCQCKRCMRAMGELLPARASEADFFQHGNINTQANDALMASVCQLLAGCSPRDLPHDMFLQLQHVVMSVENSVLLSMLGQAVSSRQQ